MAKIKGVIFGFENVLAPEGHFEVNEGVTAECGKLVRFLEKNGVQSVVVTNHDYKVTDNGKVYRAKDFFEKAWQFKLDWQICGQNGTAGRQSAAGLGSILDSKKWKPNETVFVGNSDTDMQSAVNSKILLLNAQWYKQTMDYGFPFKKPKGVARFIDVFCLRDHRWGFAVEEDPLRVYSLATFSTKYPPFIDYSHNFLRNIKDEYGLDEEFWAKYLCSGLYLSGLYESVNYITSYPCHSQGDFPEVLIGPMTRFAKCFRANYIPDLIVRHKTATKSQTNRETVDHDNQLSTICLNSSPTKREGEKYAKSPLKSGKTVLVIDDVCSKGMSFEAARAYLEQTGCKVVSVALLKALKHGYERLGPLGKLQAYRPSAPTGGSIQQTYRYGDHVHSDDAAKELGKRLQRYKAWDWPN